MDWLQSLLDNSTTPVATAFLLGLLTAISPCPLATNIAAIGYISKDINDRHKVLCNGILYTIGRVIGYTLLGIILLSVIHKGTSIFGIQKFISHYGELVIGPALILIGIIMFLIHRINLPQLGFNNAESMARKGKIGALILGIMFALSFCPSSGLFYFGMLIPMASTSTAGYMLPVVYAIATAIPVLVVAYILAFSAGKIGIFYNKIKIIEKWMNIVTAVLFILAGIYYCIITYL